MLESTEFAYAAGYIDGDGCFHLRKSPKYRANLIICSTHLENLEWFNSRFEGCIRQLKKKIPNLLHKAAYHFVFDNQEANINIKYIESYLVEKTKESEIYRNFIDGSFDREFLINRLKQLKETENLIHEFDKTKFLEQKNTVPPTDYDFAYLAGLIDAEGSLNIQKYKSKNRPNFLYKIIMQCNNTKLPIFEWLIKRFGGNIYFVEREKKMQCRNQLYWRLSAASLYPILIKINGFLQHKKEICWELRKFYETTVSRKGIPSGNSNQFSEFYRPILEERERIFHKVKLLNKKGT